MSAYAKRATAYVKFLKASAPNADLVYLGAASGLRKKGNKACGGWSTPRKLAPLRKECANWHPNRMQDTGIGLLPWAANVRSTAGQKGDWRRRIAFTSRPKGYRISADALQSG